MLSLWLEPVHDCRRVQARSLYQIVHNAHNEIVCLFVVWSSYELFFARLRWRGRGPKSLDARLGIPLRKFCVNFLDPRRGLWREVAEIKVTVATKVGGMVMHAVIRNYSGKGAKKLIDVVEKNKVEVEKLMRPIKGFVSYSLVRTSKGGFSVTVCRDKAGTDESTRAARDWIAKNAGKTGAARPAVSEGSVILHLNPQPLPP